MKPEDKLLAAFVGSITLIGFLVLISIIAGAILVYVFVGFGALLLLTLIGFCIRKWQHSGLPVKAHKLEKEHQAHLHELDKERLKLERERHEHELQLERERHEHELQIALQRWQLEQHTILTRIPYDANAMPPMLYGLEEEKLLIPPAGANNPHPLQVKAGVPADQKQLASLAESRAEIPAPYDLRKEYQVWRPSREEIFLARTVQGPVFVPLGKLWHIAFTGPTGGGKTSLLRMLMMQLLYLHCQVVLCDIHYAPIKKTADGKPIDWRPIEKRLADPPIRDVNAIADWMDWLAFGELQNRIDREFKGEPVGTPLFFTIEELPAILDEKRDEVGRPLAKILRQGRQYGICFLGASQDLLTATLKMSSGPRECFRTGYYTGGDPTTAKALLDLRPGEKVDEDGLGIDGLVYLKTALHQAMQVRTPWASNEALYELFEVPRGERLPGNARDTEESSGDPEMEPFPTHSAGPQPFGRRSRFGGDDEPSTGELETVVEADSEPSGTESQQSPGEQKRFTPEQEVKFIKLYRACGNIKDCLRAMHLGNVYGAYARQLVEERKLRRV